MEKGRPQEEDDDVQGELPMKLPSRDAGSYSLKLKGKRWTRKKLIIRWYCLGVNVKVRQV